MIILTLTSVISLQMQEAYAAAITSVTIGTVANGNTVGSGGGTIFDYTIVNDDSFTNATAVTISFTGAAALTCPLTNSGAELQRMNGTTGGITHSFTRAQLEASTCFNAAIVEGTYTLDVTGTDEQSNAFDATDVTSVTFDFSGPTFTAALGGSANQIVITWNENVDSVADSAAPWTLTGTSETVTSTTALDGTGSTQTLTLSGNIAAGSSVDVTYTAGGSGDIEDTVDVGVANAASTATIGATGIPGASNGSGCDGDCQAPTLGIDSKYNRIVTNGFTYNGKPTDVERFYTPYPLITVDVGKQNKAVFKIYENQGPQNVRHFSFAFGLGDDQVISQSKAMIELDIDFEGTETVTITDPENALDNVRVKTSTGDCNDHSSTECLIVTIDHQFRTQLDFNMVGTDVWDTRLNSWQNYYNDGIEVVGESLNPPKQYTGIHDGHLITITEIGKNTAIDQQGNTWTFDKVWEKDYIPNTKIDDGISSQVYDRNHVAFSSYKYGQELLAKQILDEFCPKCGIEAFEEIGDVKFYRYPDTIYKLDDLIVQKMLEHENEKAMKTLQKMYDEMYNHDYKRIEPFQSD